MPSCPAFGSAPAAKLYDDVRAAHEVPITRRPPMFQSHQMHGPIERRPSEVGHIYVGAARRAARADEIPRIDGGK